MSAQAAGQAFFPLDKQWGLDGSVYSPELKRQMVWLSGLLPYAQAEAVMARIGKRSLSDSSLWRTVDKQGQRLLVDAESTPLLDSPSPRAQEQPLGVKAMSMDGGMVNIRQEGWKELKVGLVGTVVNEEPPDSSVLPQVHTTAMTYAAVLGEVETFSSTLVRVAHAQGFFDAPRSSITADGAAWIWGLADEYFPQSVQIVDWYHARQHLADAAQARFPAHPQQASVWLQSRSEALFEGQLDPLLTELNQAGLADSAHYFQTHQARMRYLDFQEAGYPIGSGSVESEVKQFKHRLAAPGMRWSRPGAQRMILIRSAVLDGSFDARWSQAA
jgi:hypothetical protein